jgi:hypothetical protein
MGKINLFWFSAEDIGVQHTDKLHKLFPVGEAN